MRAVCMAAVIAAGLGHPVSAQEGLDRVAMADLLRAAGCAMDLAALSAVQADPAVVQTSLNDLLRLGLAEITEAGVALAPSVCGLSYAPGEAVLTDAIRLHGCAMSEEVAEVMLSPFGLNRTNATGFAESLIARGDATLSEDEVFTLSPALCAGAALEPLADDADKAAIFREALAANGCALTEAAAGAVLPGLGVSMAEAEDLAEAMIRAGQAEWQGDTLVARAGACDPAPAVLGSPRERFVQMMADAGCSITGDQFEAVMGRYGLTEDEAETVAGALIDAGQGMTMGEVFILDRSVCDTAVPEAAAATLTPKDRFVAAIRANGCALTEDEAAARTDAIGLTMRQMDDLADGLLDAGEASVVAGSLVLSPALCVGAETPATPVTIESLAAAVHDGGCRMTPAGAAAFQARTGATDAQLQQLGESLIALGLASDEGRALVLTPSYCESYRH